MPEVSRGIEPFISRDPEKNERPEIDRACPGRRTLYLSDAHVQEHFDGAEEHFGGHSAEPARHAGKPGWARRAARGATGQTRTEDAGSSSASYLRGEGASVLPR